MSGFLVGKTIAEFEYRGKQVKICDGQKSEPCSCGQDTKPTEKRCSHCGHTVKTMPVTLFFVDNRLLGGVPRLEDAAATKIARRLVDRMVSDEQGSPAEDTGDPADDDGDGTDDGDPGDGSHRRGHGKGDALEERMQQLGWGGKAKQIIEEVNGPNSKAK